MARRRTIRMAVAVLAAVVGVAMSVAGTAAAQPGTAITSGLPTASSGSTASCPWLNQKMSTAQRVSLVMSHMTLSDKITLAEGQGTSNAYVYYTQGIARLCIPSMGLEDGPNGVGDGLTGVTQLPAGVSLAATWDPQLAQRYGIVVGAEQAGKGASVDLGPTVNIDRDPRWGRSFESFTEDPFLNSALAVGEVRGIQSTGTMAQIKHLAAYNQETNRNTTADGVEVSDRTLHEIYLPAFWAATTEARSASAMCAYSVVNGDFSCENPYLETTTLRDRWGYQGFMTSDYAAIHDLSAASAGTDMEQPFDTYYGAPLKQAVLNGTVSPSVLDTMVGRILTEMFRFGLFNSPPSGSPTATVTTPAHQAVSTKVAEDGTVLLKNDGVLPLSTKGAGTVAVIGPSAQASPTDGGGGSATVTAPFSVTPLAGLRVAAGAGTSVTYTQGLPTDTSLAAIPGSALTPAYRATGYGQSYTGTLTAPETGTYVLAFTNPGNYTATNLSLDGTEILSNPGTPPQHTYSVAVQLAAGQTYKVQISGGGPSSDLAWATPSDLAPGLSAAAAAARKASTAVVVVSDDTESEAADRVGLHLPSAQDELIATVAAANPHTVVVVDAGAPVAMPWLPDVAGVVDAWYPGESNGTALAAVLFGAVDPSGHLPVTFPTSLSQVPASTAAQFPGVDGTVQYSEGLDVGYRWYDQQQTNPLFAFGYGLSYTTFTFSDLTVHRQTVQNRVSGPSPTACACNGQDSNEVTVTARVTNTGPVAGAEVAQLYLGDPAAAGEPPRQLKGFDKISLRPGQSRTVTFRLTGHDLSYFDAAANGWVVPDGTFHVYVGDSSALADLPLRGDFTVTRSVGARYAAVMHQPSTVEPDSTTSMTVTFVNDGDFALHDVRFAVRTPAGWSARATGRTVRSLAAGASTTVTFAVHVPLSAQDNSATLMPELTFRPGTEAQQHGGRGSRPGAVAVTTTVSVQPAVTVTAATNPVIVAAGGSAHATLTYRSNLSNPVAVTVTATPPSGLTVTPSSTTITVPPSGANATLTVSAATSVTSGRYSVPLSATLTSGHGLQSRRITLAPRQIQVTVPYSSVTAAYDNAGITSDDDPGAGSFDGTDSYSAQALAAAGLAPGTTMHVDGATLTWPDSAPGTPDNIIAEGQTVAVTGQGDDLVFVGASNNGNASGTGTVTYTDGSTEQFSLTLPDWYSNLPGAVGATSHWNQLSGVGDHPVSVYARQIPLDPGKTVAYVTLPHVSDGVGNSVMALHVFAMAVGTSTAPDTSSLAAAFDNVGITDDADTAPGNYDGSGFSFSTQALASAGLTPGGSVTVDGVAVTWPNVRSGQPDNVNAQGQRFALTGSGTNLVLVGAANNGTSTGTGAITYTDGTVQFYTVSMADWYANAPAAGGHIVATAAHWNTPPGNTTGPHQVSVYGAAVPLQQGKTVRTVTLPDTNTGLGSGATAMHIFAAGIG